MPSKIINSKGTIFYGMHFYPGVAEYSEPGKEPYRVFLNEDTIRAMDPSFAGRPIFVEHVDGVEESVDQLRKEADGWVVESFYNAADGKHWVKFLVCSERGERAVKNGFRLSNAYYPTSFKNGGVWNGVEYAKEITGGEYEHLALVKNPRYEESIVMTPSEFKAYNENKLVELNKLSNSKDEKGDKQMKLNFFKRAKVENAIDPELAVVLPKSGREITIVQLVNEMDEQEEKKKNGVEADPSHMVKLHDGSMCNVGELLEKHKALHDELEALKGKKEDEAEPEKELAEKDVEADAESDKENVSPAEDAGVKEKALEIAEHEDKEIEAEKKKNAADEQKKADAKKKADALKNAHIRDAAEESVAVEFSGDQVARGISRYGSK